MNMCFTNLYVMMIDFFNNSCKFEQELDSIKAKKCLKSAIENLPAFKETIKFIFDVVMDEFQKFQKKLLMML